jgi:hypothetical protein
VTVDEVEGRLLRLQQLSPFYRRTSIYGLSSKFQVALTSHTDFAGLLRYFWLLRAFHL